MGKHAAVVLLLLFAGGCSTSPSSSGGSAEITVERVVLCPPQPVEGTCPACPAFEGEAGTEPLIERLDRAAKCEEINESCRAWHDSRDVAEAECKQRFESNP